MNNWQILEPNKLGGITTTENLEKLDDVKVKTISCFISLSDLDKFSGEVKVNYPYTPCNIAVGQVVETLKESNYLIKGSKVFLSPEYARDNQTGYLRDFVVLPESKVFALPKNVSESQALFLNHISLALSVIDELKIEKGNHVAIFGGSILGNILAQLIMYYQSVPIINDSVDENLEIAHKTNVYYLLKNDKNLENDVLSITGGRKCSKVIYLTDCDINFDVIDKVTRENATVAVTGISSTKKKSTLSYALDKELDVKFIKSGNENIHAGINLIAQKAINLSYFELPSYKFEYAPKHFENALSKLEDKGYGAEFIIDML